MTAVGDVVSGNKAAEVCHGMARDCTKWQKARIRMNVGCATLGDYDYAAADAPDGAVCTATP